jgi:hypothetical protein
MGPVDSSTLLHRPIDEFTPKEPVLHRRMQVGIESVALPLVAPFATVLSKLSNAFARIVNLGSISQADGMDSIFLILVLIITEVDLKLIEWRSLSFRSFYWTFFMSERLLIFLLLERIQSTFLRTPGEVALLDLLTCGGILFLGGTTRS